MIARDYDGRKGWWMNVCFVSTLNTSLEGGTGQGALHSGPTPQHPSTSNSICYQRVKECLVG